MTKMLPPFDLNEWITDHAHMLVPPVSNVQVWEDSDMIVTVIGGGNDRTDYHDDPNPEFFYQLEGTMVLKVIHAEGEPAEDLEISAGQVFLLPPHVRHSPQRKDPKGIGLVVEYARAEGDVDGFEWYCENCLNLVHRSEVQLRSIVDDLPPVFREFKQSEEARTCPHCRALHPAT